MRKPLLSFAILSGILLSVTSLHAATINWKGDMRFRYADQVVDGFGSSASVARERLRYRFRYGFEGMANDQTTVVLRLASGGGSFKSTNSDLGMSSMSGASNSAYFDQACIKYEPYDSNMVLQVGKMGNPFASTILLYDGDISLGGISELTKFGDWGLNIGAFVVTENSGIAAQDNLLIGAQFGGKVMDLDDGGNLTAYASYYSATGELDRIFEALATLKLNSMFSIQGDAFRNFRSDTSTKTLGYLVEGKVKINDGLSASLLYALRQSSAFSADYLFGDSDFDENLKVGANNQGIKASVAYVPFKDNELNLTIFSNSNVDSAGSGATAGIGNAFVLYGDWVVKL